MHIAWWHFFSVFLHFCNKLYFQTIFDGLQNIDQVEERLALIYFMQPSIVIEKSWTDGQFWPNDIVEKVNRVEDLRWLGSRCPLTRALVFPFGTYNLLVHFNDVLKTLYISRISHRTSRSKVLYMSNCVKYTQTRGVLKHEECYIVRRNNKHIFQNVMSLYIPGLSFIYHAVTNNEHCNLTFTPHEIFVNC